VTAEEEPVAVRRFPVEAGHILAFSRAIGAPDPAVAEDPDGPGVLAPPTFVVAGAQFDPDYPLRPRPGEPWLGSGRSPSGTAAAGGGVGGGAGGGATTLHAEQHFTYHRPLRAGDVLTAESRPGSEWEKAGRRGGTLRFAEFVTDYRDAAGDLVVTARAVAVTTEHAPSEG
jgi:hypothetical protein